MNSCVPNLNRRRIRPALGIAAVAVLLPTLSTSISRATVEEQRARLPPAAECTDPVEGVWKSHQYEPKLGQWYIHILTIKRTAPESELLTGDIVAHFWDGTRKEEQPPPCVGWRLQAKVQMPAKGFFRNGKVEFNGGQWVPYPGPCDPVVRRFLYNPDKFSGTIDKDIQEFLSVNNDGGEMVNNPTVFRRIKCFDPPDPPKIDVKPPPLQPPTRVKSGCNKFLFVIGSVMRLLGLRRAGK